MKGHTYVTRHILLHFSFTSTDPYFKHTMDALSFGTFQFFLVARHLMFFPHVSKEHAVFVLQIWSAIFFCMFLTFILLLCTLIRFFVHTWDTTLLMHFYMRFMIFFLMWLVLAHWAYETFDMLHTRHRHITLRDIFHELLACNATV